MTKCAVNNVGECSDPPIGSMEVFVDQAPGGEGWYPALMREVHERVPSGFIRLSFCEGHLREMIQRAEEVMANPDLWHPQVEHPPIFARSGRRWKRSATPARTAPST